MRADRPSDTALLIARSLALLARDPMLAPLLATGAAEASERFVAACSPATPRLLALMEHGWFRGMVMAIERMLLPGIVLHYALRKRWLEAAARRAIDDGARQVVVLGAGFDTLATRLHRELPDVAFTEVDHPATQAPKRAALERLGSLGDNLRLVGLDLAAQTLEEALLSPGCAATGYRAGADTLFVAEGLTMYLESEQVAEIFRFARRHAGRGSRVAFTFMELDERGRPRFRDASRLLDVWLRARGEPFRWGIRPDALGGFLEPLGFRVREVASAETLRDRYLAPLGLAGRRLALGEHICLAERSPD